MPTLNTETLLNLQISSNSFSVDSLGLSTEIKMSSVNKELYCPFPSLCLFFFFVPYCTGVTYSTMSMEVTRVNILVFFVILRGKQLIVTMKDAVAFSLNFQVLHIFISLYLSTKWFFDWLNLWIKSLSNQRWEYLLIKSCLGYLAFLTEKERDWGEEGIVERCSYQHY